MQVPEAIALLSVRLSNITQHANHMMHPSPQVPRSAGGNAASASVGAVLLACEPGPAGVDGTRPGEVGNTDGILT